MRRIAVINQKGGVGKTTTAVNLGAALARLGTRVVICDLDPQCNLTVHVDVDPAGEQPSVYDVLRGEATLKDAVRPTRDPNLWVLPSSVDLAGVELELVNVVGREVLLRDAFEADEQAHGGERWDIVLCDCPPSLGLLSLNALVLCDEVLVPVQSEFFALQGLSKLTEIVELVQRRLNPRLRLCGLLSCRHDSSTNLGRQVMDDIRAHFGDVLFRSAIRRNVKLAEAPSHGKTIFEYDAESRGAEDYLALAREMLGMAACGAVKEKVAAPKAAPATVSGPPSAPTAAAPTAKPARSPVTAPVRRKPVAPQAAASVPAPKALAAATAPPAPPAPQPAPRTPVDPPSTMKVAAPARPAPMPKPEAPKPPPTASKPSGPKVAPVAQPESRAPRPTGAQPAAPPALEPKPVAAAAKPVAAAKPAAAGREARQPLPPEPAPAAPSRRKPATAPATNGHGTAAPSPRPAAPAPAPEAAPAPRPRGAGRPAGERPTEPSPEASQNP